MCLIVCRARSKVRHVTRVSKDRVVSAWADRCKPLLHGLDLLRHEARRREPLKIARVADRVVRQLIPACGQCSPIGEPMPNVGHGEEERRLQAECIQRGHGDIELAVETVVIGQADGTTPTVRPDLRPPARPRGDDRQQHRQTASYECSAVRR